MRTGTRGGGGGAEAAALPPKRQVQRFTCLLLLSYALVAPETGAFLHAEPFFPLPLRFGVQQARPFDSPTSIDGASFMQGLQQGNGNRLHSTAIEEDLNPSKEEQAKRGNVGNTRPLDEEQVETSQRKRSLPGSGGSGHSQEESAFGSEKRRNISLSTDEDEGEGEDRSWQPSQPKPKKAKIPSLERTRKTSPGQKPSSSKAGKDKKKRERSRGGTELEAMLDALLDFCDEYKDSLASTAVKQSVDCFCNNVKEQILEKIASYKDLKALKRENAKVGSKIRTKTQRLLDVKQELIRAERQVGLLQKEKADLQLRLEDLKRSQSFLRDLGQLNRMYLDHRRAHPKEKETYGASSLASLLLETKHIQGAEQQLRSINTCLEKMLKGDFR